MPLNVNIKNTMNFIADKDFTDLSKELSIAHASLFEKTGRGNDFLGWVDLPAEYDREEFSRILRAAEKIRSDSEVLVVIGIGGSYLGARAAIEFLRSPNYNLLKKDTPDIFFAGNNLSASHMREVTELIGERDFSINVISKSGTTTEPAVAFRIFKELAEKKYGREAAARRIYATTDRSRGALKKLADAEGYESFVIPDDVGGRYSVLTAVGLLPIAAAGIDIKAVMEGAAAARNGMRGRTENNPALVYAAARNLLYRRGFTTEILACYEPSFRFMAEWWKQLYGESEGKDGRGIFPASVDLSADLHSMGQYIQQGMRNLFETAVTFGDTGVRFPVPADPADLDGLNFLAGRDLGYVNGQAYAGTTLAHVDGGVPNIRIELARTDAFCFGELVYFFEYACGVSGYLLGVNPFDQPGVEAYKVNMFALLDKPGYEAQRAELRRRLDAE